MMSRLSAGVSTQARFHSESSGLLLLGHGWRQAPKRPTTIPALPNAAELCVCYLVLPPRHSGDAEQLLWFGKRGFLMPAILKRLATVTVLLVTTLFLLTASGGSYMRGELLLDIEKIIK
jgi:hypothetical protein